MSHTTMLSINLEDGTCEEIKTYSNSHGSAPIVWAALCKEYLFEGEFYWLRNIYNSEALWKLYKNPDIPFHQRAVLMMTFDRALITKPNFERAIYDIQSFVQDFTVNLEYVNHWPQIANDISELVNDPNITAIGFRHTSVSENPFMKWDDESEEYKLRDDLYDIYSELDSMVERN